MLGSLWGLESMHPGEAGTAWQSPNGHSLHLLQEGRRQNTAHLCGHRDSDGARSWEPERQASHGTLFLSVAVTCTWEHAPHPSGWCCPLVQSPLLGSLWCLGSPHGEERPRDRSLYGLGWRPLGESDWLQIWMALFEKESKLKAEVRVHG